MKCHIVGGWVRDRLLEEEGFPCVPRTRLGSFWAKTPEAMVRRGFKPVGGDFPVFLHPKTHEEYALARTERKTAPGSTGSSSRRARRDARRRPPSARSHDQRDRDGCGRNLTDPTAAPLICELACSGT